MKNQDQRPQTNPTVPPVAPGTEDEDSKSR